MTCIAFDGEIVAADGMMADLGCIISHNHPKIRIIGDCIVGASGDTDDCEAFMRWFEQKQHSASSDYPISETSYFKGLVIHADARVDYYGKHPWPIPLVAPVAIGAGDVAALAAILAGKNAVDAVHIACVLVPGCGGNVHSIALRELSKKGAVWREARRADSIKDNSGRFPAITAEHWGIKRNAATNPADILNDRSDPKSE